MNTRVLYYVAIIWQYIIHLFQNATVGVMNTRVSGQCLYTLHVRIVINTDMISFYQRRKKIQAEDIRPATVTLVMDTRLFKMTNTYFVY